MKYIFVLLLFIISSFLFTDRAFTQTNCATILSVTSSTAQIAANSPFTCTTQVDPAHTGSNWIACGISFDGKYPENYCPSDTNFGGWNGDKAMFNCSVNEAALSTNPKKVELVAFDFSPSCGLSTAMKTLVTIAENSSGSTGQPGETNSTGTNTTSGNTSSTVSSGRSSTGSSNTSASENSSGTKSSYNPSGSGNSGGVGQGVVPFSGIGVSAETFFQNTSYPANLSSLGTICLQNKSIYLQASQETGIPWQILAGIHYKEGSCDPNRSLVSGRIIGEDEPDINGNCSQTVTKGKPYAFSGGCRFASVLDSALYAGNLLKVKNSSKIPSTVPELVTSLSRYNGGGNYNCGQSPYSNCPALYYGEDDSYVMNLLDQRHARMYTIYCANGTRCPVPQIDERPGTFTISAVISKL